jgi:hypothetical protein
MPDLSVSRNKTSVVLGLALLATGTALLVVPAASAQEAATPAPTWRAVSPIPWARSELGGAAVGATIYVVGGFGGG